MSDDPYGVTATVAELACELGDAKKRSDRRQLLSSLSASLACASLIMLAGATDVSSFAAGEVLFLASLIGLAGLVSRTMWGFGIQSASLVFRRPVVAGPRDEGLRRAVVDAYDEAVNDWRERKARSNLESTAFVMSFGLLCTAAALFLRTPEVLSTTSLYLASAFTAFIAISAFIAGRDTVSRYYEGAGGKILMRIFELGETEAAVAAAEGQRSVTAIPQSASGYLTLIDATLVGMRRGRRQRPQAAV